MRKIFLSLVFVLVIFLDLGGRNIFAESDDEREEVISPKARKIVVFRPGVNIEEKNAVLKKYGVKIRKHFSLVNATAVVLPDELGKAEAEILRDSRVERIEEDIEFTALPTEVLRNRRFVLPSKRPPSQPTQTIPWGISRIKAPDAWALSTGRGIDVAILDTGIQLDHPDLQANIKGGINIINPRKTPNDDNGHGTHVAGIVGAIDNGIGVVGVAPQANLYAVKVLNAAGSGWLSDIIEGLEWCINTGMDVVNMSFGASSDSDIFHETIINAYNSGIVLVAAAGNEGGPVLYPAAYEEVIAVAASDNNDQIPSWSNSGPEMDLTAPGVNIYSTYKGSTYKTLSGTSMASPHVAGTVALVLTRPLTLKLPDGTNKNYDLNGNSRWDPAEVKLRLEDTAESLSGYNDNQQGKGLVRADRAVQ